MVGLLSSTIPITVRVLCSIACHSRLGNLGGTLQLFFCGRCLLSLNVLIVNLLCCLTKSGKFTCVLIVVVSSLQVPIEREISVTVVRTDTKKQELPT